jgi:hypothetical protein
MTLLLVMLRRSSAPYGATVAGLSSLAYLLDNQWWRGEWQGGAQAVSTSSMFMGVACLFCGALDSRRVLPRGTRSFVRDVASPVRAVGVVLLAAFLPMAVWLTGLLAAAAAVNLQYTRLGFPGVQAILLPYLFLLTFTALGILIGQRLPMLAIVPAAVVVGFLLPVTFSATPNSRLGLLTPIDDGALSPPILLRGSTLTRQVLLLTCASAALVLVVGASHAGKGVRGGRTTLRVLAGGMAVAALAGWWVGTSERTYVATDAAGPRSCQVVVDRRVCVWADHAGLLPPLVRAWVSLSSAWPDRWVDAPTGLVESGLSSRPGELSIYVGQSFISEQEATGAVAAALVSRVSCQPPTRGHVDQARVQWLLVKARAAIQGDLLPVVSDVLRRPEQAQVTWWLKASKAQGC